MKFARYWAKDRWEWVSARGWSNSSVTEARERARTAARKVHAAIESGNQKRYLYGDQPLPEPLIQEFRGAGGTLMGAVTRNAYGALVLNTERLMFVDIDEQPATPEAESSSLLSSVLSLFGGGTKPVPPAAVPVAAMAKARRIAESRGFAVRAYQTAAGYRLVVTSHQFDAGGAQTDTLLKEFDADPLYVRLCRAQQCFRARLTPKPWRCGLAEPPVSYPYATAQEEAKMSEWEQRYARAIAGSAVCRLVGSFGPGAVLDEFRELVDFHDRTTKVNDGLPLA